MKYINGSIVLESAKNLLISEEEQRMFTERVVGVAEDMGLVAVSTWHLSDDPVEEDPEKIFVKVNEDNSLGRAYIPDHINHDATPPEGVRYVQYNKA